MIHTVSFAVRCVQASTEDHSDGFLRDAVKAHRRLPDASMYTFSSTILCFPPKSGAAIGVMVHNHLCGSGLQRPRYNHYVLKQGNKSMGLRESDTSYIVGFRSVYNARRVQYVMHPELCPVLRRRQHQQPAQVRAESSEIPKITIEHGASLIIPKATVKTLFSAAETKDLVDCADGALTVAMSDGGFHMACYSQDEFLALPLSWNVGLIIPTHITSEDEDVVTCSCSVLDPILVHETFVSSLSNTWHQ